MKYLVLGCIIYFIYKFMFRPALEEPAQQQQFKKEEDLETRHKNKNPRGGEEDYIDYEEVK